MIPDIAMALEAAIVFFNGVCGVLFAAELAQTMLGLININMIAKVNSDAALRLSLLNFTNSPVPLLDRYGRQSRWALFKGGKFYGAQGWIGCSDIFRSSREVS